VSTAIEVRGLIKTYGPSRAVDDVSFDVAEGEVIAILGPNGAGKSTTIEILEGHRRRTSGEVSVLGVDPAEGGRAYRDRLGIVLQSSGIDPELTVREVIEMYGAAYSKRRPAAEVIELVELSGKADARIVSLSGGQQRRVDLALGLIGDPELIFLDEPTTGFDPAARRRSWELVENLTSLGRTVVLTTHYLDEAEHLADRVIILVGGRIVAEGTPAELRADKARAVRISFSLPIVDEPLTGLLEGVRGEVTGRGQAIEVLTTTPTADLAHVTGWAAARGVELERLTVASPGLEEVYLHLVGESADAEGVER
jgi:ABC-2 type transport system ATP-binding protein